MSLKNLVHLQPRQKYLYLRALFPRIRRRLGEVGTIFEAFTDTGNLKTPRNLEKLEKGGGIGATEVTEVGHSFEYSKDLEYQDASCWCESVGRLPIPRAV